MSITFNPSLFFEVGWWLGLGSVMAVVLCMIIFWLVGKTVDKIFQHLPWFKGSLDEYTFVNLPDHILSMNLSHDTKLNTITATAEYLVRGELLTKKFTVCAFDKDYEKFSHSAQLELMAVIQKEL